jgi:hypothetical protein
MSDYNSPFTATQAFLPVLNGQAIQIRANKVFRDDIGRVRWIVADNGQWYGLTYRMLDKSWQVEALIEPHRVWRTTDNNHFRARELSGKSSLDSDGSQLYFKGKIFVEQHSGKISVQIDSSGSEFAC